MDYNIYIHNKSSNGNNGIAKKFKPSSSMGGEQKQEEDDTGIFASILNKATNIENLNVAEEGIKVASRFVPAIAIAYAAVKITDSIATKGLELYSTYTGDDIGAINWQNFKTNLSNAFKPFLSIKTTPIIRNKNILAEETRVLSGNSYSGTTAGGKLV